MPRPEDNLPPDLHYSDTTSARYTTSTRIQTIQAAMTHRALALLALPTPSLVLDIGCGSGLSGEILSDPTSHPPQRGFSQEEQSEFLAPTHAESGELLRHEWVGVDISSSMLSVAAFERDSEGDLMLGDMGQGLPFRPGTFDGAISISAVQWLCQPASSLESDSPERRLKRFFNSLYVCLRRGARAVCQFYPGSLGEREMVGRAAVGAGFGVGLLVDDEGTKGGKTYLVLSVGGGDVRGVVRGMSGVSVDEVGRRNNGEWGRGKKGGGKGSKEWILRKKDQAERKGKVVKADSRYTGRKRKIKF